MAGHIYDHSYEEGAFFSTSDAKGLHQERLVQDQCPLLLGQTEGGCGRGAEKGLRSTYKKLHGSHTNIRHEYQVFAPFPFLGRSPRDVLFWNTFQNTNRMAGHIYDHSCEEGAFFSTSDAKGMHQERLVQDQCPLLLGQTDQRICVRLNSPFHKSVPRPSNTAKL